MVSAKTAASKKAWKAANKDRVALHRRTYRAKHAAAIKLHNDHIRLRLRLDAIEAYGGACQCCGENQWEFLTIDHLNGGGRKHRKRFGGGWLFYRWLKNEGYPKDEFRLLCYNCNCVRGHLGYCPHERTRQTSSA